MSKKNKDKGDAILPVMEAGLARCMRSLDSQIAREMQRSPAEREEHGVQKWEPYNTRIERLVTFLLNQLGDEEVTLDSLLVLVQALTKTYSIIVDDLGEEGLGEVRSLYCARACEALSFDIERAAKILRGTGTEQLN